MLVLTLSHPIVTDLVQTQLAADYAAGVTTIFVKNTKGLSAGDFIILGKPGNAQTEIRRIATVYNATELILGTATDFPHATDTSIQQTAYDQYKLYRSTTGENGTYSVLATNNFNIDLFQNEYIDTGASSSYFYKFTYFNSGTSAESAFSDIIPGTGYPFYAAKTIIDRAIAVFGDYAQKFLKRTEMLDWINELNEKLQFQITGGESPYFLTSNTIIQDGTTTQWDVSTFKMVQLFFVEVSYDQGNTYTSWLLPIDFRTRIVNNQSVAGFFRLGGDTLFIEPSVLPANVVLKLWYYTLPTLIQTESDNLQNPFQATSWLFVNYILQRGYEKDRKYAEIVPYYRSLVEKDSETTLLRLKQRIKAVGKMMTQSAVGGMLGNNGFGW